MKAGECPSRFVPKPMVRSTYSLPSMSHSRAPALRSTTIGIHRLFPGLTKTGDRARVGKVSARFLRLALGIWRPGVVTGNQCVQVALLPCGETAADSFFNRPIGAECLGRGGGQRTVLGDRRRIPPV